MDQVVPWLAWIAAYVVGLVGFLRDRWNSARTQSALFLTLLGAAGVTAGTVVAAGRAAGLDPFVFRVMLVAGGILTVWGVIRGLDSPPSRPRAELVVPATTVSPAEATPIPVEVSDRDLAAFFAARNASDAYGEPELELSSGGSEVFVVSDLHLASGRSTDHSYTGTENFFADEAFARFLNTPRPPESPDQPNRPPVPGSTLVINGDFVDFIRVMHVPTSEDDYRHWSELLAPLGLYRSAADLAASIIPTECEHGLRTTDYKSVWKLAVVIKGHEPVFGALASWLLAGNRLVIVKGNHDVEWYWPAVRNYLLLRLASWHGANPLVGLKRIDPYVTFVDHAVVFDKHLYIEHGHRFEALTRVIGSPLLEDRAELRLPFGSFVNRYIINHVELGYPFIDNIRPQANIVPVLIRERFPTALRLLFRHIPLMVKTIPRMYFRYFLARVLPFLLVLAIPALIAFRAFGDRLPELVQLVTTIGTTTRTDAVGVVLGFAGGAVRDLAWLVLAYIGAQVIAAFQLRGGPGLERHARLILSQRPHLRHVVFGHTHDPQQAKRHDAWFYNAGTWIPVLETSSASVRHDRTYTYLYLPARDGALTDGCVYRWHDEAARSESAPIIQRS